MTIFQWIVSDIISDIVLVVFLYVMCDCFKTKVNDLYYRVKGRFVKEVEEVEESDGCECNDEECDCQECDCDCENNDNGEKDN